MGIPTNEAAHLRRLIEGTYGSTTASILPFYHHLHLCGPRGAWRNPEAALSWYADKPPVLSYCAMMEATDITRAWLLNFVMKKRLYVNPDVESNRQSDLIIDTGLGDLEDVPTGGRPDIEAFLNERDLPFVMLLAFTESRRKGVTLFYPRWLQGQPVCTEFQALAAAQP